MAVVEYERQDRVAHVRLNRPERLNALNDATMRALRDALFAFDDDADADVAILSGAGRAFCSGADVREVQLRDPAEIARLGGVQQRNAQIRDLVFRFTNWKPIIAAVHGYALGGGLHIALLCDLIVADEATVFQVAETARGADGSVFWSLLRARVPEAFATDVVLTARRFDGTQAHAAGLVSRVASAGRVIDEAVDLATTIAGHPAAAVRATVKARRLALELIEVQANAARDASLHLTQDYRRAAETIAGSSDPHKA